MIKYRERARAGKHGNCFACGRPIDSSPHIVDTRDDQKPHVGPECYRKVLRAGEAGLELDGLSLRLYLVK